MKNGILTQCNTEPFSRREQLQQFGGYNCAFMGYSAAGNLLAL